MSPVAETQHQFSIQRFLFFFFLLGILNTDSCSARTYYSIQNASCIKIRSEARQKFGAEVWSCFDAIRMFVFL